MGWFSCVSWPPTLSWPDSVPALPVAALWEQLLLTIWGHRAGAGSQLDQQYINPAPLDIWRRGCFSGFGVLTLGVLLQGAKSLHKLPGKWLLRPSSLPGGSGLLRGHRHLPTQPCRSMPQTLAEQERVYARKGLTWMNCQLAGTDAGAAATFGLRVVMYGASVVLAPMELPRTEAVQGQPGTAEKSQWCTRIHVVWSTLRSTGT